MTVQARSEANDRFRVAVAAGEYEVATQVLKQELEAQKDGAESVAFSFTAPNGRLDRDDVARVAEAPNIAEAVFELGAAAWAIDGYELLAIDMFERATTNGSPRAVAAAGESLHWFGYEERAIPWLIMATENSGTESAQLHGFLGEALFNVGRDVQRAISELGIGGTHSDDFALPLAKALLHVGEYERARAILERIAHSNVYGAAIQLGNVLQDQFADFDGAKAAYMLGVETGDGHSAHNLGLLHQRCGDEVEAMKAFALARTLGDLTLPPNQ